MAAFGYKMIERTEARFGLKPDRIGGKSLETTQKERGNFCLHDIKIPAGITVELR